MKKILLISLIALTCFVSAAQAKINLGSTIRSGCQPVEPPADPAGPGN